MQYLRQFLGQNDGDRARIACVNGNGKRPRVSVVAVDVALSFPNAVGVAGRMILKSNEQDLGPEILIEGVLCFDDRQIIASGDNTAVQDHQIIFTRGKNHASLTAGRNAKQQNCTTDFSYFSKEVIFHERPKT